LQAHISTLETIVALPLCPMHRISQSEPTGYINFSLGCIRGWVLKGRYFGGD